MIVSDGIKNNMQLVQGVSCVAQSALPEMGDDTNSS